MVHELYTDADKDRPDSICDRNGQVALGLCKRCGKAEVELDEPCIPEPLTDALRWQFILKQANEMKTSRYEILCQMLIVDADELDFVKTVDDAIRKAMS